MTHLSIGIPPRAELTYWTLLRRPRWRESELAAKLGWSVHEVHEQVVELGAEGLVGASSDDPEAVRGVEPRLALPAMTARRLGAHSCTPVPSAIAVERFVTMHEVAARRFDHPRDCGSLDEIDAAVERVVAGVKRDLVLLAPRYGPGWFEFSAHVAGAVLRRGGTLRAVWCADFLNLPPVVSYARWLGDHVAVPRTVAFVPVRAMIVDGDVAVVVDDKGHARWMHCRSPMLSLIELADNLWEKGIEVRAGVAAPHPALAPRSEQVLRLLAEGLTDEAIARRIGVSVRTVRNEVALVMTSLGARSRFQAGLRAAQLGLP